MSFWKQLPPKPGLALRNLEPRRESAAVASQRAVMLLIELGIVFWVGEEGVGGERGELAAPEVGAQDALGRHPVAVDR